MAHGTAENIRVAAVFGPGNGIRPVWFDRRGRKHTVREITYTWTDKAGDVTLLHFAVSDGTALYELTYNTAGQTWTLGRIEVEG
jgi:hypothetical protein